MNRYIKIKGHKNWFLVLKPNESEPNNLSSSMQEKLERTVINELHNEDKKLDLIARIKMVAINEIDYEHVANKYNKTLLIRPIGSYMFLDENQKIESESFGDNFPIDEIYDIVICENDNKAEYNWVNYLKNRFPNKTIGTINFFDLRTDNDIQRYLHDNVIVTFSTTFSNYDWFEKLIKNIDYHKVIGYSHDKSKWVYPLKLYNVEVVKNID